LLVFLDSHDGSLINSAKNLSVKTKRNLLIAGAALALLLAWYAYLQHKESQWSEFIKSLEAAPGMRPPRNVKIAVNQTTLYVSGSASRDWITTAKPISNRIYGADLVIFNVRQAELSE